MQPDAWSILANLIYWTVLLLIAFAKALSLAVIAFGLIASAVCGLLGPIFVPFLHRAEARLAVLELAEGLHPVLVHPGCRHRVSDDFRAVRIPLCDHLAADDHVGRVRRLRAPGRRRHRRRSAWASCLFHRSPTRSSLARAARACCPRHSEVHSHTVLREGSHHAASVHRRVFDEPELLRLVRRSRSWRWHSGSCCSLALYRVSSGSRGSSCESTSFMSFRRLKPMSATVADVQPEDARERQASVRRAVWLRARDEHLSQDRPRAHSPWWLSAWSA